MINAKMFIEDIEYLLNENKITKLNAAAFIGQCSLLTVEGILTVKEDMSLIRKIQKAAGMTDEEVDEALFYRRGDDK